jgi:hypothetical protein
MARLCASTSGCWGRGSAGSRRGFSQGASRGCFQRSTVPSALTILRNRTPDFASAAIAAFALRASHQMTPEINIFPRTSRCAGEHFPAGDFSSTTIGLVWRHQTRQSGTPRLTPRSRRIRPLTAERATGSVAVQTASGGSHRSSREASFTCSAHSQRRATGPTQLASRPLVPVMSSVPNRPVGLGSDARNWPTSSNTVAARTRCGTEP